MLTNPLAHWKNPFVHPSISWYLRCVYSLLTSLNAWIGMKNNLKRRWLASCRGIRRRRSNARRPFGVVLAWPYLELRWCRETLHTLFWLFKVLGVARRPTPDGSDACSTIPRFVFESGQDSTISFCFCRLNAARTVLWSSCKRKWKRVASLLSQMWRRVWMNLHCLSLCCIAPGSEMLSPMASSLT